MSFYSMLCFIASVVACSPGDDAGEVTMQLTPSNVRGALISYSKVADLKKEAIISYSSEIGDVSSFANYDVTGYKIVYNTEYEGQIVRVSGLVLTPENAQSALHIIQHHHGTIIPGDDEEVPSLYRGGYSDSNVESSFIGGVMASNGHIVSLPDYVGYGESDHLEHPYTVHQELAEVSIDMLRATKSLMEERSIPYTGSVFSTGWSEGGGAGLALHRQLQTSHADGFSIKGSSLFAGPYDYFTFFKDIFSNASIQNESLAIYNWAAYAINKTSPELGRDKTTIWNYSVSDQMDALEVPSNTPNDIFLSTFIQGIVAETDVQFVAAVRENSLLEGWVPEGSIFLHSGTNDAIVPHYNSTNAHAYFSSVGTNSTLYEYPGEDHYSPLYEYVTTTLTDINTLQ